MTGKDISTNDNESAFLEWWHREYPGATKNIKILEASAHYRASKKAFIAGRLSNK